MNEAPRLPRLGDKVRVVGGAAPIGVVMAFVSASLAKVLWDGWCETLAVVGELEVIT